jgi:hypothetical protein
MSAAAKSMLAIALRRHGVIFDALTAGARRRCAVFE